MSEYIIKYKDGTKETIVCEVMQSNDYYVTFSNRLESNINNPSFASRLVKDIDHIVIDIGENRRMSVIDSVTTIEDIND